MKTAKGLILAQPPAGLSQMSQRVRVYRSVLQALRSGALASGDRLPSSRQLAAEWCITRGAVDEAFHQLQIEGLLERRVGDGTYVAGRLPPGIVQAGPATVRDPSPTTRQVLERLGPLLQPVLRNDLRPLPLTPNVPEVGRFPLQDWKRCLLRALDGDGSRRSTLWFGPPAGVEALREATARHLMVTGAAQCRPEQVLIVNSVTHALELVARVLLEPGDEVALEDPGHASAARILALSHLKVSGVPLDDEGLSVEHLRRHTSRAACVLLTPFNQYPLGVVTSAARAAELMRWADTSGAWIVDMHVQREIAHDAPAPPPLALLDTASRVVTIGSYMPISFPSMRLAYVVVPERLVDVFTSVRGLFGDHCNVTNQLALASFIRQGHAANHVRDLRALYRRRRDALRRAAERHLPPQARLGATAGGFNAAIVLPPELGDARVAQRLEARGVRVGAISHHCWQVEAADGLAIGYGAHDEAAIDAAVATIGREIEACSAELRRG